MRSWELNGYSFSFDIYLSFLSTLTTFLPKITISFLVFSYSSSFSLSFPHFHSQSPSLSSPTPQVFLFPFPILLHLPKTSYPSISLATIMFILFFLFPSFPNFYPSTYLNSFIPLSHSPSLSFPPIFSHPNPLLTSLLLFLISLSNVYLFNQSTLTPSYFSANPPVLPHPPSISFLPLSPSLSLPIHLFTLPPSDPIPTFPFPPPSLPSFTPSHSLPSPSPILSLFFLLSLLNPMSHLRPSLLVSKSIYL